MAMPLSRWERSPERPSRSHSLTVSAAEQMARDEMSKVMLYRCRQTGKIPELLLHSAKRRLIPRLLGLGRQMKCDVDALGLAPCPETKPAALEHLEHRGVIGQDLCNQFFEPRGAGNDGEMVQQFCANPLPLVLVNDNESNFGLPRLHDDVAAAADDQRSPAFLQHGDRGHVRWTPLVRQLGWRVKRESRGIIAPCRCRGSVS